MYVGVFFRINFSPLNSAYTIPPNVQSSSIQASCLNVHVIDGAEPILCAVYLNSYIALLPNEGNGSFTSDVRLSDLYKYITRSTILII